MTETLYDGLELDTLFNRNIEYCAITVMLVTTNVQTQLIRSLLKIKQDSTDKAIN